MAIKNIKETKEVMIIMATQKTRPKSKINKQKEIEQRKRKKKKKILKMLLVIILLACFVAYLSTSPTFKIQEISVKGNEQLTKEKVKELAEIKIGDNIFSKIGIVLEVKLKQNGYVEDAKINKIYPNKIEIEITERKKRFQIKTESESYIYIDDQGYILDFGTDKLEIPTIIGMDIAGIENNKRLDEKNLNIMENILQIREECEKIELADKITQIKVEDEYILNLENDGITINLGDATNLKNRMYYVSAILKQETGNSGTIYVNGNLNEGFLPYFSAN